MPPKEDRSPRSLDHKKEARILANRYEVIKKLGCGSHGTVYLVSDLKNSEELNVVKEIYIGDLQPDETVGAVNEARLLCKLNHPGIVKFLDSFIDGDFFCIVTEFCEGGDLDILLQSYKKAGKELDRDLLLNWFVQLLLAVQYMHQRNVLHRDLKSKNIFLKNNMIKIGDFGISRILLGSLDKATTFTGTPYYMAPEVLNQDGYNSKSDIWSLGVILYQMCQLEQAFQGKSLPEVMCKITKGEMPMLSQKFGEELQDLYSSMLCRDPIKRASSTDILKMQFITKQIETLKIDINGNIACSENEVKYQTDEIAEFLRLPKKKKAVDKSRIHTDALSARDKLRQRKKLKGDIEAEKLKKITASVYEESRQQYSNLKQRQSIVAVPFVSNEHENFTINVFDSNYRISNADDIDYDFVEEDEDGKTLVNNSNVIEEYFEKSTQCTDISAENVDDGSVDTKTLINNFDEKKLTYTHCFGESVDNVSVGSKTIDNKFVEKKLTYTHCFGEDDTGNDGLLKNIFTSQMSDIAEYPSNVTLTTTIPDDETTADTFYSGFNDFEDDSGNSDSGELEAVADCLQNALELRDDMGDGTLVNTYSHDPNMVMRQQKIISLRSECIKLLGEDGFSRVYKFLNKARFESHTCMSEPAIMKKLRKLVSNPRDCFLVDQLLFLEKQNQVQCM